MNMFEWEEDNFSYEDSDHFEEVRFFRFTRVSEKLFKYRVLHTYFGSPVTNNG